MKRTPDQRELLNSISDLVESASDSIPNIAISHEVTHHADFFVSRIHCSGLNGNTQHYASSADFPELEGRPSLTEQRDQLADWIAANRKQEAA